MKYSLITGAGRGIGKAIALRLASPENHLYLTARSKDQLEEVASEIKKKGGKASVIEADLSEPKKIKEITSAIDSKKIDLLVNNAGMAVVKPFEELSLDDWQRTFSVNVTAPFLLLQQLLPRMTANSTVVNIISVASKTGFPQWSSYCMSKFALDGFARSVREELRPRGIRVINIYPGAVDTEIWADVPGEWTRDKMMSADQIAASVEFAIKRPQAVLIEDITIGNTGGLE